MNNHTQPLVRVSNLTVSYKQEGGWTTILHRVGFSISRGQAFGLVGESGSGKSTLALHLLGFRHPASRLLDGQVFFGNQDLLRLNRKDLNRLRGKHLGYVPQNPTTALNPGMHVGEHVVETLLRHKEVTNSTEGVKRAVDLFRLVELPNAAEIAQRYPHQLSGGQQQRVCIALALACNPELLILDEPTTGLDVTTQKQIIDLLNKLRAQMSMAILYVTHDLGALSQVADRVGVMYAGHMIEIATTRDLFHQPRHPYTKGLIASAPRLDVSESLSHPPLRGLLNRRILSIGCPFQPRCDYAEGTCKVTPQTLGRVAEGHDVACQRWQNLETPKLVTTRQNTAVTANLNSASLLRLSNVTLTYHRNGSWFKLKRTKNESPIVSDFDLEIGRGESVALVGESGSGKSTVARAIAGLLSPVKGVVTYKGQQLPGAVQQRTVDQRREIQYIFQNPDASLNPRMRVAGILARPLQVLHEISADATYDRVMKMLGEVQLDASYANRFPDQLSGGERQRIAIARALIVTPDLILCDEILSALDVSVQANILELLADLRARHGIAMLFISHDLAVVHQIVDRVVVLFRGRILEHGKVTDVFNPPYHPYTQALMEAIPRLGHGKKSGSSRKSLQTDTETATGCAFCGRCPLQIDRICQDIPPPWRITAHGKAIRCHLSLSELEHHSQSVLVQPADDLSIEPLRR